MEKQELLGQSITLKGWREELLRRILLAAVLLGAVALIPSLILSWRESLWFVFVADIVAYLLLIFFTFFPGIPHRYRARFFVFVALFVGSMLQYALGVAAAAFLWLLASILLALLLLGRREALVTTVAVVIVLAGITALLSVGNLSWEMPIATWITYVANFVAITGFLVAATAFLLHRLLKLLRQEHELNREKQLLIREIQHRVKNNLQLMVSLLRLQGSGASETVVRNALESSEARLKAMSLVHETLYRSDVDEAVELSTFVPFFLGELSEFVDSGLEVESEVSHHLLSIDQAIPFSILLEELFMNALRHAFPDGGRGAVSVRIGREGARLALQIEDNGVGFEPGELTELSGTGLTIVHALAEQLSGALTWERAEPGTRVSFQMPV